MEEGQQREGKLREDMNLLKFNYEISNYYLF